MRFVRSLPFSANFKRRKQKRPCGMTSVIPGAMKTDLPLFRFSRVSTHITPASFHVPNTVVADISDIGTCPATRLQEVILSGIWSLIKKRLCSCCHDHRNETWRVIYDVRRQTSTASRSITPHYRHELVSRILTCEEIASFICSVRSDADWGRGRFSLSWRRSAMWETETPRVLRFIRCFYLSQRWLTW